MYFIFYNNPINELSIDFLWWNSKLVVHPRPANLSLFFHWHGI